MNDNDNKQVHFTFRLLKAEKSVKEIIPDFFVRYHWFHQAAEFFADQI